MLSGPRVLLVEDDQDARELLSMLLVAKGAIVTEVSTGEEAIAQLEQWSPDVVVMDLSLPGIDGLETFKRIRERSKCPGIALSGHGREADRARSCAAGFMKHLLKPAAIDDIISAITMATKNPKVRGVLEQLNRDTECQFTSVLRFAKDGTLVSVWTYDRTQPEIDTFAVDLPITDSYCVLLRDAPGTYVIEDARTDTRAANHPKRDQLAAYLGVPLFEPDGTMFGTLCSYDVAPRHFPPSVRAAHENAATTLVPLLHDATVRSTGAK